MWIFDQIVARYWGIGAAKLIERKTEEEEKYKESIKGSIWD